VVVTEAVVFDTSIVTTLLSALQYHSFYALSVSISLNQSWEVLYFEPQDFSGKIAVAPSEEYIISISNKMCADYFFFESPATT
jgi:hypothetical protein